MDNHTRFVSVEVPGFEDICVEALVVGREQDVADIRKAMSFGEVNKTIESVAAAIKPSMEKVKPDKATVEFGIALSVESGKLNALLVQGSATCTLKISLTWGK